MSEVEENSINGDACKRIICYLWERIYCCIIGIIQWVKVNSSPTDTCVTKSYIVSHVHVPHITGVSKSLLVHLVVFIHKPIITIET